MIFFLANIHFTITIEAVYHNIVSMQKLESSRKSHARFEDALCSYDLI